ncbi:hypothetical protein BJ742DRAFT_773709 [Cladochytrium replicatum]|nr:hypothetical protein BJ742DRAFT_773709 [Cladochytrium replicatum]
MAAQAPLIRATDTMHAVLKGGRPDAEVFAVIDSIKDDKINLRDAKFSLTELYKASEPLGDYIKGDQPFPRSLHPRERISNRRLWRHRRIGINEPWVRSYYHATEPAPVQSQRFNDRSPVDGGIAICAGQKRMHRRLHRAKCWKKLHTYFPSLWIRMVVHLQRRITANNRIGQSTSWSLYQDQLINVEGSVSGAVWDGPVNGGE